jgi:hypothetical protein
MHPLISVEIKPHPPKALFGLLGRYLERVSSKLRGAHLPEATAIWRRHGLVYEIETIGFCTIPGTGPKDVDKVDEFGFCLAGLSREERELVINDYIFSNIDRIMDDKEGFEGWKMSIGMSKRRYDAAIQKAWLKLWDAAAKAGLTYYRRKRTGRKWTQLLRMSSTAQ